MSNDLFGGLGGLMKGLTGLMPKDDPEVQMLTATTELEDLKKQQSEIYEAIGKKALATYGDAAFSEQTGKLRLIESNIADAEAKLNAMKQKNEEEERLRKEAEAKTTCPSCGFRNPEGVKFCNECGAKLGATKAFCVSCGAELAPGTRFCGECGAKQPE